MDTADETGVSEKKGLLPKKKWVVDTTILFIIGVLALTTWRVQRSWNASVLKMREYQRELEDTKQKGGSRVQPAKGDNSGLR
jgi:hypothetical protein